MVENVDLSPTKRARKPNFTTTECTLLFEVAEQHLDITKTKFTLTMTNKSKTKVWKEITGRVNSLSVCKRTAQQVKDKWPGMASRVKRKHKCVDRQPDSIKGTKNKIIEIFGDKPSFSGLSGSFDSGKPLYF